MICQKCGLKSASVHITKIYNNNKVELNLCRDCAEEYTGRRSPLMNFGFQDLNLDNLISGFFGINTVDNSNLAQYQYPVRCDNCNTTLDEIKETGRVGCARCYKIFKDSIIPIVKKVHGNTQHVGCSPNNTVHHDEIEKEETISEKDKETKKLMKQIDEFKKEMKDAISREDYEKAAELRDSIKKIEEKLSGGGI